MSSFASYSTDGKPPGAVLGANASVSFVLQTDLAQNITGTVFADQAGTLYIEQSFDGTNFDVSASYSIAANTGEGFSEPVLAPSARIRFVNGGTAQTAHFRLFGRASSRGT